MLILNTFCRPYHHKWCGNILKTEFRLEVSGDPVTMCVAPGPKEYRFRESSVSTSTFCGSSLKRKSAVTRLAAVGWVSETVIHTRWRPVAFLQTWIAEMRGGLRWFSEKVLSRGKRKLCCIRTYRNFEALMTFQYDTRIRIMEVHVCLQSVGTST